MAQKHAYAEHLVPHPRYPHMLFDPRTTAEVNSTRRADSFLPPRVNKKTHAHDKSANWMQNHQQRAMANRETVFAGIVGSPGPVNCDVKRDADGAFRRRSRVDERKH